MLVFLEREDKKIHAQGEFNLSNKSLTVLAGSIISDYISSSPTFRGASSIKRDRKIYVEGCVVKEDVKFKSPSTAANFVTGTSTNGLLAWKDSTGIPLKNLIK